VGSVPLAGRAGLQVQPFDRGIRAGVQFVVDADSPVVAELWEPFVSSHTIPGAGLGLAVARSMAKALDMVVEVRTVVDEPQRVRLVLTLARGAA
jgi:nitrogen-specific signal transduction histidine kinase